MRSIFTVLCFMLVTSVLQAQTGFFVRTGWNYSSNALMGQGASDNNWKIFNTSTNGVISELPGTIDNNGSWAVPVSNGLSSSWIKTTSIPNTTYIYKLAFCVNTVNAEQESWLTGKISADNELHGVYLDGIQIYNSANLRCGASAKNLDFSCFKDLNLKVEKNMLSPGYHVLEVLVKDFGGITGMCIDASISNITATVPVNCIQNVQIRGFVYLDANNNGQYLSPEALLSDVVVKLYNNSGTLLQQTLTKGDGTYDFYNVTAGNTYIIKYEALSGTSLGMPNGQTVVTNSTILNYGMYGLPLLASVSISGYTFHDANTNGFFESAVDKYFGPFEIRLLNANDVVLQTIQSAAAGNYLFSNLISGNVYKVRIITTGSVSSTTVQTYMYTLSTNVTNANFGLKFNNGIQGKVFQDANSDALLNNSETVLPGYQIQLYKGNTYIRSITSDGTGNYLFANLFPDTYKVQILTEETLTTNTFYSLPVLYQLITDRNFGVKAFNCIECITSFSPTAGEEYILSAWVKESFTDNPPTTYRNSGVRITFNDGAINTFPLFRPAGPIVDGWQRIEASFVVPAGANNIHIALVNESPNTDAFFDDIRVHPYNSNMKSFVYNPSTQKLVAELDENNFATLYEYDDEGILIRVKKETERGVMTIKETRSNQSKIQTGQ